MSFLSFGSQYFPYLCDICCEYSNSLGHDDDQPYAPHDIPKDVPLELVRVLKSGGACNHKFCVNCLHKSLLAYKNPFVTKDGSISCPAPWSSNCGKAWTAEDFYDIFEPRDFKKLVLLCKNSCQVLRTPPSPAPMTLEMQQERIQNTKFPDCLTLYCATCDTALEKRTACNEVRHCNRYMCWICGLSSTESIPLEHWRTCPRFEFLYHSTVAPAYACEEGKCYTETHNCQIEGHTEGLRQLFEYRKERQLGRISKSSNF